jgi:hypothetical protein
MIGAVHEHIEAAQARRNVVAVSVEFDQFRDLRSSRKLHEHRAQRSLTKDVKSELPRRLIRTQDLRQPDEQIDALYFNEPPDEANMCRTRIRRSEMRDAALGSHPVNIYAIRDHHDLVPSKMLGQCLTQRIADGHNLLLQHPPAPLIEAESRSVDRSSHSTARAPLSSPMRGTHAGYIPAQPVGDGTQYIFLHSVSVHDIGPPLLQHTAQAHQYAHGPGPPLIDDVHFYARRAQLCGKHPVVQKYCSNLGSRLAHQVSHERKRLHLRARPQVTRCDMQDPQ